jgi:hypothetical protein
MGNKRQTTRDNKLNSGEAASVTSKQQKLDTGQRKNDETAASSTYEQRQNLTETALNDGVSVTEVATSLNTVANGKRRRQRRSFTQNDDKLDKRTANKLDVKWPASQRSKRQA